MPPSPPRKKNYAWVWFFVFVVVASIAMAGFMIVFNLRLQLKPEQLADAMARWQEHGPADYVMTYTKQLKVNENTIADTFVVKVRAKKVFEVRMNGEPLRDADGVPIVDERLQYHSMDSLLRYIERFLELDAKAGQKNYNLAIFDEQTGALRKYVRSDKHTRQHVDEEVKIEPLPP
jgi:hypothetical protein